MRELRVETAFCLAMEFIGDLDSFQADKPSNWLVQSDDDPDFQAGIAPATIGRIRQLDNPDGTLWWNDTYRHTIFLLLPKSLTSGLHYCVVMRNVGLDREAFILAFEERTNVSRAIKANQYGYLPSATNFAYLGDWLGSAGPLDLGQEQPVSFFWSTSPRAARYFAASPNFGCVMIRRNRSARATRAT